ncbi:heme exporter protein CcmB [Pseudorhodoplanes sp.]|uniref:heme exporter protein CcmB n=1 Tax=Pseudorhodoplanes sp. TaxID=1934341 RepID=UPI002BFE9444|nr:heme exporter protein CcmB [Pseudorhodoplanes sp.]HWV52518.1 heme exporter protein CcmB [Pseudorhodoplanes sp.]
MSALSSLFLRDIRIAIRVGGGAMIGVLFFMSVVTLIPFAIGPDLALLQRIGPAILWLGALLASLLALDRLLAADQEDGSLDLLVMGSAPLELAVAVKALAHWLTTALPLVIVSPLLALFLNLDLNATAAVAATLLAGTPALTFIGLIGAGLTVTLRRGGLLLPVLILPLAVPVLIFGVSASNAAVVGPVSFGAPFTILCALTLMSLVIGPFAAAAALRAGQE